MWHIISRKNKPAESGMIYGTEVEQKSDFMWIYMDCDAGWL
jgi:hypothetical protein